MSDDKEVAVKPEEVNELQSPEDDVAMTFPQKLMQVVSDEEYKDIISWLPHGKGFIIYKKKKFASDILPKHFKQSKYTSFTRKLNRWGFTRVTRGPETGAYYHKLFQRGDPRLCTQMSCQSTKSGKDSHAMFPPGKGFPGDLQNQQLIRQQLQQLQMHQFHLQQIQMQQQHMQAAELFRQQQAKSGEGGEEKDKDETKNGDSKPAAEGAPAVPSMAAADNPYLQSLQQAGVAPPMGLLPVFQAGGFAGIPPGMMMPPAPPGSAAPAPVDGAAAPAAEETKSTESTEAPAQTASL